jgi:hypothetical protein
MMKQNCQPFNWKPASVLTTGQREIIAAGRAERSPCKTEEKSNNGCVLTFWEDCQKTFPITAKF